MQKRKEVLTNVRKSLYKKKLQFLKQKKFLFSFIASFLIALKILSCRIIFRFNRRAVIVIGQYESIGDIIACGPVVKHLKKKYPQCYVIWVLHKPFKPLLENNIDINKIIGLDYFHQWIWLRKLLLPFLKDGQIVDLHINNKPSAELKIKLKKYDNGITYNNYLVNRNLLQAFTTAAGLPALNEQPFLFVRLHKLTEDLPENFIVIHTHSNMKMKDWLPGNWDLLCKAIIKKGYCVYEIGINAQVSIMHHGYINYTGKKAFGEIAYLIKQCSLFIGIDSGFAHMANALQKEGIVLIGQYIVDKHLFEQYNPFSGKYSDTGSHIIFSNNGSVKTIPVDKVIQRVNEKLQLAAV